MLGQISQAIDWLSAKVFAKISLFGVEVEGIVLWLVIPMILFSFYLGLPQIRGFRQGLKVARGHFHEPAAPGEVTQFAALATAVSGTVGLGNIAGVAVAVSTGGPGAVFWMCIIGFFAMCMKCAEVTLGLKFREIRSDGTVSGGPFWTLSRGLASIGLPKTGRLLGLFYAFLMLGGCLSLFQVNQSFLQIGTMAGITENDTARWIYGIFFALAVGAVLIGSIKWIARVTSVLVPFMCGLYILGCLAVILTNIDQLPNAVSHIVHGAFSPDGVAGGALGVFVIGMRRAIYSSEAGIGTAVIAHSAAKTREPASEGLVALLEPFLDTIVICTLSGLTLVIAGTWNQPGLQGVQITSAAFASVAGWFPYVLALAVFLFGYSTVIANGYYGVQAWAYLFGPQKWKENLFKILFCCILPLGAVLNVTKIVDFVDSVYFLMAIPNIIGLYLLAPVVRKEISSYFARIKSGEVTPNK
jgi:AGCS family alanine or glycine:cation symporter